MSEIPAQAAATASLIEETYPYHAETGDLLYEVVRMKPKGFRQRRPDGKGGWIYNTNGVRRVLYRLPEVTKAKTAWLCEGEKDADTLTALGFCGTTADGGAGNCRADLTCLKGKAVFLCGDNDEAGEKHVLDLIEKLHGIPKTVSRIRVPAPHKDISDYINDFGDDTVAAEACRELALAAEVIHGPLLRSLADIEAPPENDPNELIKHRWLCKGGTALFVAPAGVGKSSFLMQSFILWSLAKPAFGLVPVRPLKCVFVQAENDDGDLAEMRDGVLAGMELTEPEIESVVNSILFRTEYSTTGPKFCQLVSRILEESKADIIAIDPVLAYLGGSMNDQEVVGTWLRNHLLPVLKTHNAAAFLVHHTNKPPSGKEKPDWKADELSYLGGGSSEFANFCRAVLAIRSIGSNDIYELRAAKRGGRLRWKDGSGSAAYHRFIRHSNEPGVICWHDVSEDEAVSAGAIEAKANQPKMDEYLALFPNAWTASPNDSLLNSKELRRAFLDRGWDYRIEPKLRALALSAGTLKMFPGARTEKLIGKPNVVDACRPSPKS